MNANISDTSAARGRIIKRGGIPAPARTVEAPARLIVTEQKRAAAPTRSLRDPITLFLIIPMVFSLSAAFTWTRPLDGGEVSPHGIQSASTDRFHMIGSELSGRFAAEINGRVMPAPARKVPPHKASVATLNSVKASLPVASGEVPKHGQREVLEKQVYKILKTHGKPTQNGRALASAIVKEALSQDYDPVFVAAVIKSESAFNALARSHKGAQGLMQIMPKTGAWLADQQNLPRGKLTDPGHNLKLGITYLKQLEAEYKGNRMLTLVAYNWGPGHVESAASGSRRVPGEVMQYAVKILNDYRRWSSELRSSVG